MTYVAGWRDRARSHERLRRDPTVDTGTYTFLADYLPARTATAWSTATAPSFHRRRWQPCARSLSTAVARALHCLEHGADPPQGLEPFNFEEANLTGFPLGGRVHAVLRNVDHGSRQPRATCGNRRASSPVRRTLSINSPGRQFRSAVEMSQHGPVHRRRAERSIDQLGDDVHLVLHLRCTPSRLGLDLSLRDRPTARSRSTISCGQCGRCTASPADRSPSGGGVLADRRPRSTRRSQRRPPVRR